jgi:hypothetical protein
MVRGPSPGNRHGVDDRRVAAVFSRQYGLATMQQLLDAGATRAQIRSRLAEFWRVVLPGVVAETPRAPETRQRLVAALLYAGPGSMLASCTAAAYHGIRAAGTDRRVLVDVPHHRRVRSQAFVVIRRTRRPDPYAMHAPVLWIASRPRAVADAARDSGGDRARALVLEAVQRQIVTLGELRHQLETGPRQGSRALRDALREAEAGAWSVPEADLARLVRRSRVLPPMWANPMLTTSEGKRLPRPDGWFDDVALAVQVHSRRYHAGELDWEATVSTDGVFAEHGIALVAITPRQIAIDPDGVLSRVERAYEQARRRPRPDIVAVPIASAP